MHSIESPFWRLVLPVGKAVISSLQFDGEGSSQWGPNLLKTSSPKKPRHPIATVCGAQSGYFDDSGAMHLSSSGKQIRLEAKSGTAISVEDIAYGQVRERWEISLEGPRLRWVIEQTWLADVAVADAFAPGFFFAAHAKWGEAAVFQLWDRGMGQDGYYSLEKGFDATVTTAASRRTRIAPGGWGVAKFLSHARPGRDLRVTVSHHLKKGEVLNFMSLLGQSPGCEPRAPRAMQRGESLRLVLELEPAAAETGVRLGVDLSGPLRGDTAHNRRFFDTHANCAILADTRDWRFGNEPSGYVAEFCSFMYSQIAGFGVAAAPLGADVMNPAGVLTEQMKRVALNLISQGTAGGGYQSDTSLDILPSFLCSFRDLFLLTGDRALAQSLWAGAREAAAIIGRQMAEGKGMISTARLNGNDYWDWISRDGRIGSINVLAAVGLRAQAEVAEWLGDAEEARRATALADTVQATYASDFWSEEKGFFADWVDRKGDPHFFLYVGPQLQAITAGLVPPARARRVVDAILARRHELGTEWEKCFSLQTNFYDAEGHSMMRREHQADVTRFGQTMNGGCLVSWNFYWIGALVKTGHVAEAIAAWQSVVRRFAATSLIEGCNYWDFSGQPSKTAWHEYEVISYEPFLSDQGLTSLALPRWLLGVAPTFQGITVAPALPADAYPAKVSLMHLGRERTIEIKDREHHSIV